MRRSSADARGFTLLEAIVAVAILGIALMPLLSYISQMSLELRAAGDTNARSLAQSNVLALIEPLNPMDQPQGEIDLGTMHVSWTSRLTVPLIASATVGSGLSTYALGFYDVDVQVRNNQVPWFAFTARKIGFRSNQQQPGMP